MWKDIKGYEDKYQINTFGEIRNKKGKIIIPWLSEKGYLKVSLYKNNIQKNYFVHRLVAETFIPNPENKPCVDHINGCKTMNHISNLRWATYSENTLNPNTHQRFYKMMWS